jgi:hypothetical protein
MGGFASATTAPINGGSLFCGLRRPADRSLCPRLVHSMPLETSEQPDAERFFSVPEYVIMSLSTRLRAVAHLSPRHEYKSLTRGGLYSCQWARRLRTAIRPIRASARWMNCRGTLRVWSGIFFCILHRGLRRPQRAACAFSLLPWRRPLLLPEHESRAAVGCAFLPQRLQGEEAPLP